MKKLSQKDKTMLLVVATAIVLGGLFWFYVKPAKAERAAQESRVAEAQASVDKLKTDLAALVAKSKPGGRPATTNIADSLRLAKAYPSQQDIPATILQLEELAKKANVDFEEGTPDKGTDYAGTTGTAFAIKVTGKYFAVQDFVYRLHNQVQADPLGRLTINGRLFAVTKAELGQASGGSGTTTGAAITASSRISATITAVAFSRSSAVPGAAAGGATTTPTSTGGATQ